MDFPLVLLKSVPAVLDGATVPRRQLALPPASLIFCVMFWLASFIRPTL
jgi:hypothetical protein